MDPCDLVGMARICGLDLIALTDHNSAKNCPAAAEAARKYGVGFIPGIEVNTSEDIHSVCLFPDVDAAMAFDAMLYEHIPFIPNRPDIFGEQKIIHVNGEPEIEHKLLITGCDISIMELPAIVAEYGGLCWPAHVDRDTNGLFGDLAGGSGRTGCGNPGILPGRCPAKSENHSGLRLPRHGDAEQCRRF